MSGGIEALQLKEEDVIKLLAAGVHLGASNLNFQMESFVYKRKPDGVFIINLKRTWEKLLLAARIIVSIENPADVCVTSARPYGQRAVLKFAIHTGAVPVAGRFIPGTFTNQIQAAFKEPRLLIVCDPRIDHQPLTEASYVNVPVIAFCNTDSPLRNVDVAIPCNNKGVHAVGLMWWLLAREVLRMRGSISRQLPWEIMPDLYFYRDPDEIEKDEQAANAQLTTDDQQQPQQPYSTEWGGAVADQTTGEWGAEPTVPGTTPAPFGGEDWGASREWGSETTPEAPSKDWGAETASTKDWAPEPAPNEWGAEELQPSGEWGTSVTMKDANSGADWA